MLKQISKFKFEINEREYVLLCENDSPTTDVKEVASQLIKMMCNLEDQAKSHQDQVKTDLPVTDEVKDDESAI